MKILTFDTEEWYIEKHFKGGRKEKYRQYDELLDWILNTLEKNNTKATFFCVGQLAVEFPDVLKKIANAGHEIGSHSNTHPHVNNLTAEKNLEEIKLSVDKIEKITGYKTNLYRAPYGEYNNTVIKTAQQNGFYPIQWNLDTLDY